MRCSTFTGWTRSLTNLTVDSPIMALALTSVQWNFHHFVPGLLDVSSKFQPTTTLRFPCNLRVRNARRLEMVQLLEVRVTPSVPLDGELRLVFLALMSLTFLHPVTRVVIHMLRCAI